MIGTPIEHLEFEVTRRKNFIQSNRDHIQRSKEQIEKMEQENTVFEDEILELQAAIEKLNQE